MATEERQMWRRVRSHGSVTHGYDEEKARVGALHDAELHLADFGDHGLVPWRVPDEFDIGFVDAGEGFDLGFGFLGEDGAHAAAGGGEGHLDGDEGAVAVAWGDLAIVDEAEVDDVDGDFGVVAGLELVPDALFIDGGAGVRGRRRLRGAERLRGRGRRRSCALMRARPISVATV